MGLKTYLLIRIGLDVGREEWFGEKPEPVDWMPVEAEAAGGDRPGRTDGRSGSGQGAGESGRELPEMAGGGWRKRPVPGREGPGEWSIPAGLAGRHEKDLPEEERARIRQWDWLHPLKALRRRRTEKLEALREQERKSARERERAELLGRMEASMDRLASEVAELAGSLRDCHCVYEDSLRKALLGEEREAADSFREEGDSDSGGMETLPGLWRKRFQVAEFGGYRQRFWVEQLLPRAVLAHFVILGNAPCLFAVIESCARRMKSLRWILPEEDCGGELLGFVEDFCTEYGLAIMLQPMESAAAMKRFRIGEGPPVNVLDFTGEAYMAVSGAPRGSVWLDMCSLEEKRRRIEARGGGITYTSLKEMWKTVQKRCVCPIVP